MTQKDLAQRAARGVQTLAKNEGLDVPYTRALLAAQEHRAALEAVTRDERPAKLLELMKASGTLKLPRNGGQR